MSASYRSWPGPGSVLLGLIVVVLCSAESCPKRPIVARVATQVEADGTIEREVRLSGGTDQKDEPLDAAWWRERANVDLAARANWPRVEEGPGWIAARGRFADAAAVPPPIAHVERGEGGADSDAPEREVSDRDALTLERRDLVLLTHFVYREEYGDPFDESARSGALDVVLVRVRAWFDEALRHQFGPATDLSAADEFLDRYLRAMAVEIRRQGDLTDELPDAVYRSLGVPPPPPEPGMDEVGNPLEIADQGWLCALLAERLAARGTPATAHAVWRAFRDYAEVHGPAVGGHETEPLSTYLWGVYGVPVRSTTIRFEWRLVLPGRLLRTNGMPDGDAAVWSFPDDRLSAEDRLMTAESALLRRDPLRALRARTKYDAVEIERLVELLTRATAEARTRDVLQRAVDAGDLKALRVAPQDDGEFPTDLFAELADLLDPATRPLPGP